jgi:hypothetical protein
VHILLAPAILYHHLPGLGFMMPAKSSQAETGMSMHIMRNHFDRQPRS